MGNCLSCGKTVAPKRCITLAVVGVDGAGKTTFIKGMIKDDSETAPTVGFSSEKVFFKGYEITLFDLGGGKKIRDIWSNYFHEAFGIIYLIDSVDKSRFLETKENLEKLMENEMVKGKPVLLLANKNDVPEAIESVDVLETLGVEDLVNINKCPSRIFSCSAIKGSGRKVDPAIKEGLLWLCSIIDHNWDVYSKRVDKDVEQHKLKGEAEKEARRERLRKKREEREKLEKEKDEKEEAEDEIDGNPFKPLDYNELSKKEKLEKEARRKEKEEKRNGNFEENKISIISNSRLPPLHFGNGDVNSNTKQNSLYYLNGNSDKVNSNDDDDDNDNDDSDDLENALSRTRKLTPRLPPLDISHKNSNISTSKSKSGKRKKSKKKLMVVEEDEDDDYSNKKSQQKSASSLSKIHMVHSPSESEEGTLENDNELLNKCQYFGKGNSGFSSGAYVNKSFDGVTTAKKQQKNAKLSHYDDESENDTKIKIPKKLKHFNDDDSDDDVETSRRQAINKKQFHFGEESDSDAMRKTSIKKDKEKVYRRFNNSLEDDSEDSLNMKKVMKQKSHNREGLEETKVKRLKPKTNGKSRKNKTAPSDDDSDVNRKAPDYSWTISPKKSAAMDLEERLSSTLDHNGKKRPKSKMDSQPVSLPRAGWDFAENLEGASTGDELEDAYAWTLSKSGPNMDTEEKVIL